MPTILDRIVSQKRADVDRARTAVPVTELQRQLGDAPSPRGFVQALKEGAPVGLIAEVKKASPSAGLIRPEFEPVDIARMYESNGASCISVLTDEPFFQGHLDDLRAVREVVSLPVLRKDFVIDPYQVVEGRVAGADCILLIAEILDDATMATLYETSLELGMDVLIEFYEPENLERVLRLSPTLVGINNRNLKTFETSLSHTMTLRKSIPPETLVVGESGIRTRDDVCQLADAGVGAMLVGESLMRSPDVGAKVRELLGHA